MKLLKSSEDVVQRCRWYPHMLQRCKVSLESCTLWQRGVNCPDTRMKNGFRKNKDPGGGESEIDVQNIQQLWVKVDQKR